MRGGKIKPVSFENISNKEVGYMVGLLAGDGYLIYDKKSRHYHVEFYLNSERQVQTRIANKRKNLIIWFSNGKF